MLDTTVQEAVAEQATDEQTLSILDLLISGGTAGMIVIGVLFVLLFTAVYIYFERFFAIKSASKVDDSFMTNIKSQISSGNTAAAKALCQQSETPVSRLTEKGISRIGSPLDDINTAIENAGTLGGLQVREKREYFSYSSRCCSYDWFLRNCNWYGIGLS